MFRSPMVDENRNKGDLSMAHPANNGFPNSEAPLRPQHEYSDSGGQYSEVSSVGASSDGGGPQTAYQLKTMCLARKTVQMPTKEEHGFLLFCGLGARKWQCAMDCNSLTFKQAILNIYPRLRSVIGYNLWTLTRDKKTFERIPEKVNTPRRIRSYLGSQFTGCLIIVPVTDIVLMEEKREHLRQIDIKSVNDVKMATPTTYLKHEYTLGNVEEQRHVPNGPRSLCLICGKIEKTAGTGTFHKILEEKLPVGFDRTTIAKKLTDVLGFNFEQGKRKFIASEEICKKCLRIVCDIVKMEEQLKASKEELVSNFFNTTSKFNKSHREVEESAKASPIIPNQPQAHIHPATPVSTTSYPHPFLQRSLPLPMALFNQQTSKSGGGYSQNGLIQFYPTPGYTDYSQQVREAYTRPSSEYGGSDIGSSSFLSVSPPPTGTRGLEYPMTTSNVHRPADSEGGNISPRPFDNRSYASTFSFRSTTSSVRSKAQIKSYTTTTEEQPEDYTVNAKGDQEEESPGSLGETSPRLSGSPTSSSESPDGKRELGDDEEREERKKPWKKRKRVQESSDLDHFSHGINEAVKEMKDDSNESQDCQHQLDPGTSGEN